MDERYTNSLIDSTKKYLSNLQDLGINDPITIHDLNTFKMFHRLHVWATWMSAEEKVLRKLVKLMECVIRNNSNLKMTRVPTGIYYTNVNTFQTDYTWKRILDDPNLVIHETIV